jgi:KDO2-lipid IV(A) lauroyltransferase
VDPEVARVARRAFENYGRMLADFVLIGALDAEEVKARGRYEGREHVDGALEEGRGAIIAVPHMGSWDMAGSLGGALGYPIHAVAERFPGSLDEIVVSTRQRLGLKVIPLGRSAVRQIIAALKSNSIVALLCDLPHGPGLDVEFFGGRATVPAGPASLALKTGARLLPASQWRIGPARYCVRVDAPLEVDDDDPRSLMQRVIRRFEDFIRERPDQWYAFRPLFSS